MRMIIHLNLAILYYSEIPLLLVIESLWVKESFETRVWQMALGITDCYDFAGLWLLGSKPQIRWRVHHQSGSSNALHHLLLNF